MNQPGTDSSPEKSIKVLTQEILRYFKGYFRNPVQGMKCVPDWDWSPLVVVLLIFSVLTGVIAGIISQSTTSLLGNIFVYPIMNFVTLFLITGILFYLFQYLYNLNVDYRRLFTAVFLAALPAIILRILSPLDIPVSIVGVLAACFLLSVGLIENFFLPRKGVLKLMGAFFGVFFVFWMYSIISISHEKESTKVEVTKESLDILQKELTGK